jgi:hypothetical protein
MRHVTGRRNPRALASSYRGWEIRGIVEVGFGLWRAWLACALSLDLDALDPFRKKAFATKEELMIVASLVSACKMRHESMQQRDVRFAEKKCNKLK